MVSGSPASSASHKRSGPADGDPMTQVEEPIVRVGLRRSSDPTTLSRTFDYPLGERNRLAERDQVASRQVFEAEVDALIYSTSPTPGHARICRSSASNYRRALHRISADIGPGNGRDFVHRLPPWMDAQVPQHSVTPCLVTSAAGTLLRAGRRGHAPDARPQAVEVGRDARRVRRGIGREQDRGPGDWLKLKSFTMLPRIFSSSRTSAWDRVVCRSWD